jgi:hypothetical protein
MKWLEWFWHSLWCEHARVHRLYGDEIRARGYRRWECDDCGRAVKLPPLGAKVTLSEMEQWVERLRQRSA